MKESDEIIIGLGQDIVIKDVHRYVSRVCTAKIDKGSLENILASREVLTDFQSNRTPIYGLSTQFGDQVRFLDDSLHYGDEEKHKKSLVKRQKNLVLSHNIGLGQEAPEEFVRAAMLLRAHCLAQGYSGVRKEVIDALLNFLNKGIHPVVKRYGSIGASGDLIPLSGIAAALVGENTQVHYKGEKMSAKKAMQTAGLKPLKLEGREGLALINGTSFMTGISAVTMYRLQNVYHNTLCAIGMSLESLGAIDSGYESIVHKLKNHKGEQDVNSFLLEFWTGSKLIRDLDKERKELEKDIREKNYRPESKSLQDYYSIRSVAQGFGPFHENMDRSEKWIEDEMNSVNDNPIIDAKKRKIHHSANFMGYYIVEACDMLKTDIAQASTWIHALLANMVHARKSFHLPTNLVQKSGIVNGYRPVQILAASLAVQNRKLAQSHQAYMLPTEGDNQDVNSLGTHAAYDFAEAVDNLARLTSILLLASSQALEWRDIKMAGKKTQKIFKKVREVSPYMKEEFSLRGDIEVITEEVKTEILS